MPTCKKNDTYLKTSRDDSSMLDAVKEVTIRGRITRKMNSPPRLLNNGAFHHLLNTPIGIDFLQYLSRGLNNLELLLSSQPYKTQSFSHLSS